MSRGVILAERPGVTRAGDADETKETVLFRGGERAKHRRLELRASRRRPRDGGGARGGGRARGGGGALCLRGISLSLGLLTRLLRRLLRLVRDSREHRHRRLRAFVSDVHRANEPLRLRAREIPVATEHPNRFESFARRRRGRGDVSKRAVGEGVVVQRRRRRRRSRALDGDVVQLQYPPRGHGLGPPERDWILAHRFAIQEDVHDALDVRVDVVLESEETLRHLAASLVGEVQRVVSVRSRRVERARARIRIVAVDGT